MDCGIVLYLIGAAGAAFCYSVAAVKLKRWLFPEEIVSKESLIVPLSPPGPCHFGPGSKRGNR